MSTLFKLSYGLYVVSTEAEGRRTYEVAYAPVILTLRIETLDDLLPMLFKPEFRKIDFLSPDSIALHRLDLERLFFRMGQMLQQELKLMEQKYVR